MEGERSKDSAPWEPLARELFEQVPGFLALFEGPEHRVVFVNRAWRSAFGDVPAPGTRAADAFPSLHADPFFDHLDAVYASGESRAGHRHRAAPAEGAGDPARERFVDFAHHPLRGANGAITGVLVAGHDVTAAVLAERGSDELMRSERAARAEAERVGRVKDEFLATLSHELRTPLNSIMGWAQLLRSGRLGADKAKEGVERIIHNGKAQGQLISDLLDVNAIASAKLRLQVQRLPLARPLDAALDSVRPDADEKGVALLPPESDPEILVDCDPDRMQQVFWNLLANAIKFTPAGGTVAVAVNADREAGRVRIGIADSGCGIDAGFLPHLFERFAQADGTSTRRYAGLGLGLSICKTLVEMHGGEIRVHSDGPGQGATFLVELPSAGASADAPTSTWGDTSSMGLPPEDEAAAVKGLRVLLVDDDVESRSFVSRLLEEYGAVVTESESAAEALAALAISNFGLVICDIGMPGKDGFTLMREVRASPSAGLRLVHAIALTAFARREDELAALDAGFDAYIAKPAEPARILRTCLRVLSGQASHLMDRA
jgi:signal transduction histidine kinase/ActR/RegA family two-component response regulator